MSRRQALTHRETSLFDLGRLTLESASSGGDQLRAAPDLIAAGLQLDYVQMFELLPLGDAVRLIGSNGPDHAAVGAVELLTPDCLPADLMLHPGQPVIIADWQAETRLRLPSALREAGVVSSVATVISTGRGERVYGFLGAHSREPRTFSDEDILFLETAERFLACSFAVAGSALSFRALVEDALDLIVRFDRDRRIIYANPATERLTGTAAGLLIGKTIGDLGILEPIVPRWELLLGQVWRTGREQSYELTVLTPTGERIFDSRIVPESGSDGSVQSLLTISRDMTEQRRAEADRSALYQQVIAQQNRVQELMCRLERDWGRALEHSVAALPQPRRLTDRDRHVLRLVAAGHTNREIGGEIGLTVGTVKNQVARILSKLNVADRTQAAVRAVALGLVDSAQQEGEDGEDGSSHVQP